VYSNKTTNNISIYLFFSPDILFIWTQITTIFTITWYNTYVYNGKKINRMLNYFRNFEEKIKIRKTQTCLFCPGAYVFLCCSVFVFVRPIFLMVPFNLTCQHYLPHLFIEHLFNWYNFMYIIQLIKLNCK